MDAEQPPAPLGDASVALSVSQGSARKFVSNKGANHATSRSSSSRVPFSRHRLLGGNEVAAVKETNTSRSKTKANAEISIVTSISRGNASVPETPSNQPCQNSAESVLPDIRECLEEVIRSV